MHANKIYNTQETQLSSKSEITGYSAVPQKQRTVATLAVMAMRNIVHIHASHIIAVTI